MRNLVYRLHDIRYVHICEHMQGEIIRKVRPEVSACELDKYPFAFSPQKISPAKCYTFESKNGLDSIQGDSIKKESILRVESDV